MLTKLSKLNPFLLTILILIVFILIVFGVFYLLSFNNSLGNGFVIANPRSGPGLVIEYYSDQMQRKIDKPSGKFDYYDGGNVCFHSKGNVDTVFVYQPFQTIITSHVNEAITNGKFILVDQKPLDSIFGPLEYDSLYRAICRRRMVELNYEESIKLINASSIHDFWLIQKIDPIPNVYGPLSYPEYQKKRVQLGVPDNLRLKIELDSINKINENK